MSLINKKENIKKKIRKSKIKKQFDNYLKEFKKYDEIPALRLFLEINDTNEWNNMINFWINKGNIDFFNNLLLSDQVWNKLLIMLTNYDNQNIVLNFLFLLSNKFNLISKNENWKLLYSKLPLIISNENLHLILYILSNLNFENIKDNVCFKFLMENKFIIENLNFNINDNHKDLESKIIFFYSLSFNKKNFYFDDYFLNLYKKKFFLLQDFYINNDVIKTLEIYILKNYKKILTISKFKVKNYYPVLDKIKNLRENCFYKIKIFYLFSISIPKKNYIKNFFVNNIFLKDVINQLIINSEKKDLSYVFKLYISTYGLFEQENIKENYNYLLDNYEKLNESSLYEIIKSMNYFFIKTLKIIESKDYLNSLKNEMIPFMKKVNLVILEIFGEKMFYEFLILFNEISKFLSLDYLKEFKKIIKSELNLEKIMDKVNLNNNKYANKIIDIFNNLYN